MTEQREPRPEADAPDGAGDCRDPGVGQAPAPISTARFVWRIIWRILIGVVGSVVILAGIGISIPGIPGPGFLVILAGLAILATEFSAPRRFLRYLRNKVRRKDRPTDDPDE